MHKFKFILTLVVLCFAVAGCQTVKQKTDAIVEKENEKLSEFIGKSASKLQMELGKPDEDFTNAKGNFALTKESTIKYFRKVEDGEILFAHGFEKKSREGIYQVNVTNQNKENVAEFTGLIHYTSSKWSN